MTEKQFQAQVVQLATTLGYLVYHTYDSRRSQAGFPDLVLVGRGRVVFVELKTAKGRVSPAQKIWLSKLREVHPHVYLLRPDDVQSFAQFLSTYESDNDPAVLPAHLYGAAIN